MINRILYSAGFLLFIFLLFSCKKDHGVLNADVQPENDVLHASSGTNFPVTAFSVKYDSIVSLNNDSKFLGWNNDPRIGTMNVGLYLNASMSVSDLKFESPKVLVGAELRLAINTTSFVGKSTSVLNYTVFALDSAMKSTRTYYSSNTRLHSKTNVVGTGTTTADTSFTNLVLKLPLSPAFAQNLFSNTSALVGNDAFQGTYKGFYIVTSANDEGVIHKCNLGADISGLYLHYKDSATAPKNTFFKFSLTGSSVSRYNTTAFTPVTELKSQFNGDSAKGGDKLFLKGLGGSRLKVKIPFLKNYGDTFKVSVNRAEVIFYPDPVYLAAATPAKGYDLPLKLALLAMDSLGREALTLDQRNTTYISRYDGTYDTENKRYVFNIPLHAQAILSGKLKNYGFYLVVAEPEQIYAALRDRDVEGVILGGYNTPSKPVFNMSYVRLNKD